jgi:hypothetical protein
MSRVGLEPTTIGLKVATGGRRRRLGEATGEKSPDLGNLDKVDRGRTRAFVHFCADR